MYDHTQIYYIVHNVLSYFFKKKKKAGVYYVVEAGL
jgi:hypothetical protein